MPSSAKASRQFDYYYYVYRAESTAGRCGARAEQLANCYDFCRYGYLRMSDANECSFVVAG